MRTRRFDLYPEISLCVITTVAIGLLFFSSVASEKAIDYNVYAQSEQLENDQKESSERVTIKLDSVKFAPLTNTDTNQLKVDITYHTNDPTLVNTIMAGVMKVYTTDGTLIKTSTIPNGYVLGQSGPMHFATSFEDNTLQEIKAEITMTDTTLAEKLSNTLTVEASLEM